MILAPCWYALTPRPLFLTFSNSSQVKLYYHKTTYNLHLGQLCTIWTAFIAASSQAGFQTMSTVLMTSISPERDNSSYCMLHALHENMSICRMPLNYHLGGPLDKHFTLASFISGNHEIEGVRLIVCVKSIGARKSGINPFPVLDTISLPQHLITLFRHLFFSNQKFLPSTPSTISEPTSMSPTVLPLRSLRSGKALPSALQHGSLHTQSSFSPPLRSTLGFEELTSH